ncbi:MAG: cation:proton antiporter [Nanoarchaeota archaeon]
MAFVQESMVVFGVLIIIVLAGLLAMYLSRKLRISEIFLLLVMAVILKLTASLDFFIKLNLSFLNSLLIVLVSLYVFHYYQKSMELKEHHVQLHMLKTILAVLAMNTVILGMFFALIFYTKLSTEALLYGFLCAMILSGIEIGHLKYHKKYQNHRAIRFLNAESHFIPFFVLVYGYTILNLISKYSLAQSSPGSPAGEAVKLFISSIIIGIGIGMIVSLVVFRIMRQFYNKIASPLFLLIMTVIAYMIAEMIGGDGVYTAIVMGMFFAKVSLKKKEELSLSLQPFYDYLLIFLVIFLGLSFDFPSQAKLYWFAFLLFILSLILRAIAINVLWDNKVKKLCLGRKEKIFTSMVTSRGPVLCLLILSLLANLELADAFSTIITVSFLVLLYSIILSTILMLFFSRHLLEETGDF